MRALTYHGVESLAYETVADPAIRAPGDAIVRVEAAGVCGSDLHVYHGREVPDAGTVMGHELAGEVVETGPEAGDLRPGDRVVAPFTTSCGGCFYCRSGLTARCERGELFGWVEGGRGLHGAQAESVRVPLAASTLVRVPESVPAERALLAGDVLATGFYGAERAGAGPGAVVAVVGCGAVGLCAAIAARELGAERVFALDPVAERRALAERFGAEGLDPGASPSVTDSRGGGRPGDGDEAAGGGAGAGKLGAAAIEAVREATGGRGANAVVEAVGTPAATRLAVALARPGGTIAALGVHHEAALALSPAEAYDKNLTYRAGRCPARHYLPRLLELLAAGRIDPAPLISHRLPLAEGAAAYALFAARRGGCTKAILLP
jgi:threonine dehydrogenase-like Zn-dependent dehydrogenase